MIKFCVDQWEKNKEKLMEILKKDCTLNSCSYLYLVQMLVKHVLNDESPQYAYDSEKWDFNEITVIDNGDYQGTLLFMIPRYTYQPSENDYLITYVDYGSCSGCDTLQAIQSWEDKPPTESQLNDYMTLCLHLIENMKMPYNNGYAYDTKYDEVTF